MEMAITMPTPSASTPCRSFLSPVPAVTVNGRWRQGTKTTPLSWSKKPSLPVIRCSSSGAVREIKEAEFDDVVLKADRPVLVEFVATWCGPCRLIAPAVLSLAQEYKDKLIVVKVDHDSNPRLIEEYKVYGLPTLIVFQNGQEVPDSKREGAITKAKLKHICLNSNISMSSVVAKTNCIIRNVLGPEPVSLPDSVHLFDWHDLRLWHKEVDEDCHHKHPSSKEEEQAKPHVAEHGQEELTDEECEEHVD